MKYDRANTYTATLQRVQQRNGWSHFFVSSPFDDGAKRQKIYVTAVVKLVETRGNQQMY